MLNPMTNIVFPSPTTEKVAQTNRYLQQNACQAAVITILGALDLAPLSSRFHCRVLSLTTPH